MSNRQELEQIYEELQKKISDLADEQTRIYDNAFQNAFKSLYEIEPSYQEILNIRGWNMNVELPENLDEDIIARATGAIKIGAKLSEDFKRYVNIILEGKKLMQQKALVNLALEMEKQQKKTNSEGWKFLPVHIIAPIEWHASIMQKVENDLLNKVGLFSSKIDFTKEDEFIDQYLNVEVYGVSGSFAPFLTELQRFNVDKLTLGIDLTRVLFMILDDISKYLKDNTNRPQAVKNFIIDWVAKFKKVPVYGNVLQISILQGLSRMLECCDLEETSSSYNDMMSLHDWIIVKLGEQMMEFTLNPLCLVFSENDMERLNPFCDYLYYGTDIGKTANEMALKVVNGEKFERPNEYTMCDVDLGKDDSAQTNSDDSNNIKKNGRPTVSLWMKLIGDNHTKERTLKILHRLIDGRKGKDVALAIIACQSKGLITTPTFKQVLDEFGDIGHRSGYSKYVNNKKAFTEDEIKNIARHFTDS